MTTIYSPNKYEGRTVPVRVIVLHTMETDEGPTIAEAVGSYFSRTTTRASAHVGVDPDSLCRYVDDEDTAWAAPGANADGLQLEMAGRAGQTSGQWDDAASKAILENGARQVAAWCQKFGIPVRMLTDEQLADGRTKGVTTHAQVSRVFKRSDHTDPGVSFPATRFLARVSELVGVKPTPSTPAKSKPANVTVPAFPGTVRRGSRGPAVLAVQKRLKARGWRIVVDGDFGPATESIVEAFQTEKLGRKAADGIAGPNTWRALWSAKITK